MICKTCGCDFKSKYMIRIDHKSKDPQAKRHFESSSKKSVVGWIKFIMNEFSNFETCTIYDLVSECPDHEEYYKKR